MSPQLFQQQLLSWFDNHGRKDLPWQQAISPYRVWVSEIMLQQTQVTAVIPYYQRLIAAYPDVGSLSAASTDDVLALWTGLGYYARARNLHKAARIIHKLGYFPDSLDELLALPDIGRSTAGAILSIAFNKPHPILDGNVKRVLTRFCAISGWPGDSRVSQQLWDISAQFAPEQRIADYTQAIMDLGATLCTRNNPVCGSCPLSYGCQAYLKQLTAQLPTPRKSKILPVKTLVFLLAQHKQQVLLEKRPPLGLWGGLWSLPEFNDESEAENWCHSNNLKIQTKQLTQAQRHTFSHFHLDYRALIVKTDGVQHFVQEIDRLSWHNTGQIDKLGLATPIKQLLVNNLLQE